MKATGSTIKEKVGATNCLPTVILFRVNTKMGNLTEKEFIIGLMVKFTMVNLLTVKRMATVFGREQKEIATLELG